MHTLEEWRSQSRCGKPIIAAASILPNLDAISNHTIGISPFLFMVDLSPRNIANRNILLHLCIDPKTDARRRASCAVNRASIVSVLQKNGFTNMPRVAAIDYWEQLWQSKFVASPEGNGIDCHRTYEALWCGCIPIVERAHQKHVRELYGENVPILWTDDYSEITPTYLENAYGHFVEQKYDFSNLFIENLSIDQQTECTQRAQFWLQTTQGGTIIPPNMWEAHRTLLQSKFQ